MELSGCPASAGRHDAASAPLRTTTDLTGLAAWLDAHPQRRAWLRSVADDNARAIHRAIADLASRGEVCASTVRLDLRVQELAQQLTGEPVTLTRVCAVRRVVQGVGGLCFGASGVSVRPL